MQDSFGILHVNGSFGTIHARESTLHGAQMKPTAILLYLTRFLQFPGIHNKEKVRSSALGLLEWD